MRTLYSAPIYRTTRRLGLVLIGLFCAVGVSMASPIEPSSHPHPEEAQLVHEAEHAVDYAWETYHTAALGGTLASPILQVDIEQHLHDARALVPQAQQAAERGDTREVNSLVGRIRHHTNAAVTESMEHKQ